MSNFTKKQLNEIKEIVKAQLQAKSSKAQLRTKSKRELYFEQFNKIADVELRDRCKELYEDEYFDEIPESVISAIDRMCDFWGTKEGSNFWFGIIKRTDLETNPYIISKWKPEGVEVYYTTNPTKHSKYDKWVWGNCAADNITLERGLVFRTPEEAIEATDKMLEAIKK